MSTPKTFSSPAAIRAHALTREDGNARQWFSRDTMSWHATRLERGIARGADGRWYFIVSNDPGASINKPDRRYAVCCYDPRTNYVSTVATMLDDTQNTAAGARAVMNRHARGPSGA